MAKPTDAVFFVGTVTLIVQLIFAGFGLYHIFYGTGYEDISFFWYVLIEAGCSALAILMLIFNPSYPSNSVWENTRKIGLWMLVDAISMTLQAVLFAWPTFMWVSGMKYHWTVWTIPFVYLLGMIVYFQVDKITRARRSFEIADSMLRYGPFYRGYLSRHARKQDAKQQARK